MATTLKREQQIKNASAIVLSMEMLRLTVYFVHGGRCLVRRTLIAINRDDEP